MPATRLASLGRLCSEGTAALDSRPTRWPVTVPSVLAMTGMRVMAGWNYRVNFLDSPGRSQVVSTWFERGDTGLFYATSHDMRGLIISRPTYGELIDAIPQAITDLHAAGGVAVSVQALP